MAITREFTGWNKPCLHEAAARLLSLSSERAILDLHHVCVVLPGARAGRRLVEILLEQAEARDLALIPPRIVTTGSLPELLYTTEAQVLNDTQRLLLWMEALAAEERGSLGKVIPHPPPPDDFISWHGLAQKIDSIYVELSGENLSFGDIAKRCQKLPGFVDEERWEVLEAVFRRYVELCSQHETLDLYEARRRALAEGKLISSAEIYLVGCSDLNRMTRLMLERSGAAAVAIVPAPAEKNELFDEFGCILVDKWSSEKIDLSSDQIEILQNPAREADAALRTISSWGARFTAGEISVGVGDPALGSVIMQRFEMLGVSGREASGVSLKTTSPLRFLEAVLDCLRSGSFFEYATLSRHPAVFEWVGRKLAGKGVENIIALLDKYQAERLQELLAGSLPGDDEASHCAREVTGCLRSLLFEFSSGKHTFSVWAKLVSELLIEVFGGKLLRRFDQSEGRLIRAMECLQEALLDISAAEKFHPGELSGVELLSFLLSQLSGKNIPYEGSDEEVIEILGWLELALDDAKAMVILSVAEGLVPEALNSDPFLPDSLRRATGLLDNERRLARDAFSLTLIAKTRADLKILSSRTDARGEPRFASRLLFACGEDVLAARVQAFQQQAARPAAILVYPETKKAVGRPERSLRPEKLPEPPSRISVTGFRDYLECPYRYYLKHILRLGVLNDCEPEIDARNFGTLSHNVLKLFAGTSAAKSSDAVLIRKVLKTLLEEEAGRVFGNNALATVRVQLGQLEARLAIFADWQASWVEQGWEIRHSEFNPEKIDLQLGAGSLTLSGRIDRVDHNARTGEWAVFDYKTGDRFETPEKMHRRRNVWVDLQLPAYLYLLRKSHICESARPGYIALCSDPQRIGAAFAQWSEEELAEAYSLMQRVGQAVFEQKFWPPRIVPSERDDFAVIYRAAKSAEERSAGE